jgi:hypothetical protein
MGDFVSAVSKAIFIARFTPKQNPADFAKLIFIALSLIYDVILHLTAYKASQNLLFANLNYLYYNILKFLKYFLSGGKL